MPLTPDKEFDLAVQIGRLVSAVEDLKSAFNRSLDDHADDMENFELRLSKLEHDKIFAKGIHYTFHIIWTALLTWLNFLHKIG